MNVKVSLAEMRPSARLQFVRENFEPMPLLSTPTVPALTASWRSRRSGAVVVLTSQRPLIAYCWTST